MTTIEYLVVSLSLIFLGGYHATFFYQTKKTPGRTEVGKAHARRSVWVDRMIAREDRILAIQTLRNWTMSATYLASTAILIAAGLLGFLVSVDKISTLVLEVNVLGSQDAGLLTLKLVLLIANFFAAFFNFTLSLRFYNYVALDIGAADQSASQEERKEIVGHLIRAANHYTWGMRGYDLCIPILLWIFGPLWLLAGSVLTTVALYRHDHVAGHRSI